MFTNNFYNAFKKSVFGMDAPSCKSLSGAEKVINESNSIHMNLHFLKFLEKFGGNDFYKYSNEVYGTLFGDGTKAPTKYDYCLSGNIVYENLGISSTISTEITDTYLKKTAVFTISNNNDSEITIGEVGWCAAHESYRDNFNDWIMMDRTLVEPVLVIPAGDVGQLTYSLTSNFPNFEEV